MNDEGQQKGGTTERDFTLEFSKLPRTKEVPHDHPLYTFSLSSSSSSFAFCSSSHSSSSSSSSLFATYNLPRNLTQDYNLWKRGAEAAKGERGREKKEKDKEKKEKKEKERKGKEKEKE